MNILVIGNGFDLAHGLPTTYQDFLKFTDNYRTILKTEYYEQMLEVKKLIDNNVWIQHFKRFYQGNGWIDFEKEISNVIQIIDRKIPEFEKMRDRGAGCVKFNFRERDTLKYFDSNASQGNVFEYSFISQNRERMLNDLNKLVRCFEIYLDCYINCYPVTKISPDIREINIDKVLSFNYTNTYARIYDVSSENKIEYEYIHGKADINHDIRTNNMVLGIDEYLSKKRKNKEVEFIAFKKYFQKIYKGTGCKYKEWVQEIQQGYNLLAKNEVEILDMFRKAYDKEDIQSMWLWYLSSLNNSQKKKENNNLYIFGHSLDITDKDVLGELILNDNIHTTIYYPDKNELGRKIANLVKVIGQDELIKRTGGSTKTIEFKLQQDMIPIND